ncbi:MAG: hypothetical protein JO132_10535 [Streptosporangiaceae bacterium]|nr:hypothetical protein [Streptosporangiaceae bacterium]
MDPQAKTRLQIGIDPTVWVVSAGQDAVAAQLTQTVGPVTWQVVGPLEGTLVLSPRAAGSVLVLPGPPDVGGVHPTGATLGGIACAAGQVIGGIVSAAGQVIGGILSPPGEIKPEGVHPTGVGMPTGPAVYLPSPIPATLSLPGHLLASGSELPTTVESIRAAMANGTSVTLALSVASGGGVLVLNGATLAFVVLVLATA